jgi:DNA-binding transcriptional LysR family regulator
MSAINLDLDVLRTLLAAQRLGGFGRAAEQVGRSQSAVSQQIDNLEKRQGQPLFHKQGRGLVPTEAGETVLAYARRILDLNDEAVAAVRGAAIEGEVRFGLPGDFAETSLPTALGRFKRAHPGVHIEAAVDRNAVLMERLDKGQLDLALAIGRGAREDAMPLATLPMVWLAPCIFRSAAIDALDAAGIPWTITFTSPSLPGLWAAVAAGLGITIRTQAGIPDSLRVLGEADGLPPLPAVDLALHDAGRQLSPAAQRLKTIMLEALNETIAPLPGAMFASAAT